MLFIRMGNLNVCGKWLTRKKYALSKPLIKQLKVEASVTAVGKSVLLVMKENFRE